MQGCNDATIGVGNLDPKLGYRVVVSTDGDVIGHSESCGATSFDTGILPTNVGYLSWSPVPVHECDNPNDRTGSLTVTASASGVHSASKSFLVMTPVEAPPLWETGVADSGKMVSNSRLQRFFSGLTCDKIGDPKSSGLVMGRTSNNAGHQARGFIYFGYPHLANFGNLRNQDIIDLCFVGTVRAESTSKSHTSISGSFAKHSSVVTGKSKEMPLQVTCDEGEAEDGIRYCQAFSRPATLKIDASNAIAAGLTAIDVLSSDLELDTDATIRSGLVGSYTDPITLSVQMGGD